MSQLAWAERERLVIGMHKKGTPAKEIARQLKMSLRDIYKIINKHFASKQKELTEEHQAVILFMKQESTNIPAVAIKLRIPIDAARRYYSNYIESLYLGKFGQNYGAMQGYLKELAEICKVMKNAGLNVKEVIDEYNAYMSMNH